MVVPATASQMRAVLSLDPVTTRRPLGLKVALSTESEWPFRTAIQGFARSSRDDRGDVHSPSRSAIRSHASNTKRKGRSASDRWPKPLAMIRDAEFSVPAVTPLLAA